MSNTMLYWGRRTVGGLAVIGFCLNLGCTTIGTDQAGILQPREDVAAPCPAPRPSAAVELDQQTDRINLPPVILADPFNPLPGATAEALEPPNVAKPEPATEPVLKGAILLFMVKKYGISIDELAAASGLKKTEILAAADKHGINLDELAAAGAIKGTDVLAMDTSARPPAETRKPPVETAPPKRYIIVKRGDVLSKLAIEHKVPIKDLMRFNKIKRRDRIYIGQRLWLEAGGNTGSATAARKVSRRPIPSSGRHIVRKGECLSVIAGIYGLSTAKLKEINGLVGDKLIIGQVLVLKEGFAKEPVRQLPRPRLEPPKDFIYTIKKGDNLWDISRDHDIALDKLRKDNNLKTDILIPGRRLILKPEAETETDKLRPPPPVARNPVEELPSAAIIGMPEARLFPHFFDPETETLAQVAALYGSRKDWILRVNPSLKTEAGLKTAHEIQIPVPLGDLNIQLTKANVPAKKTIIGRVGPALLSTSERIARHPIPASGKHIVQAGESLSVIARIYGISVTKLKKLNRLIGDKLNVGQVLILKEGPGKGSAPAKPQARLQSSKSLIHTVKRADTLWNLATIASIPKGKSGAKSNTDKSTAPQPLEIPKIRLPYFVDPSMDTTIDEIADMYGSRREWILAANPNVKNDADLKRVKEIQVPVEDIKLHPTKDNKLSKAEK